MWNRILVRHATPILALALCFGVVLGGSIPEFGNVTAYHQGLEDTHVYNVCFLVVGILGVVVCGLALRRRLLRHTSEALVK